MSNNRNNRQGNQRPIQVNVNEHSIGEAAGEAAGDAIEGEMRQLRREVKETNEQIGDLKSAIGQLQKRISKIERSKARAKREATAELKDKLEQQVEEKRAEYQKRIKEVLDDYRNSIERLKDRFLNSISDQGSHFGSVEDEFDTTLSARSTVVERSDRLSDPSADNYEDRIDAVLGARNRFIESIDEFLADRKDTADTIDSLQTRIPDASGRNTVTIPFWVYGIEKNGREEIRVLPVLERGSKSSSMTQSNPYNDYLRPHPTHGLTEIAESLESYVAREEVRDALADRDDEVYADPSNLGRWAAKDRFTEALQTYAYEQTSRSGGNTSTREAETAKVTADD